MALPPTDSLGAGKASALRVTLASPLPPPIGGISQWTAAVVASSLAEDVSLRVFDTAPRDDGVSGRSRFRHDRALASLRMLWGLGRELWQHRPHVLHVNTSNHGAMLRDGGFVWIARALGVRTVLHFRGGDFPEFAAACPAWAARLLDATLRRTDLLIALTRETEEFLVTRVSRDRVVYLPNFVDPVLWDTADSAPASEWVEILYVGWMIEAKGVRELLRALQQVPATRLTLVGPSEPAFAASLEPLLKTLGDRVRVLPARPRAELAPLYAAADIFAFPTWREGFPNVVLEAMAAGLPLVTTPVGAIPDIVRAEVDALLVPVRDVEALAGALRELANDPSRRRAMGAAARERALDFSRDRVFEQLTGIWQQLAGGQSTIAD